MIKQKTLPLAIMLASSLAAPSLSAQESGPALEEVVVTAQKRAESLQDTPISLEVYGSEAIQAMGFHNAKDIGLASPSLQTPSYPTNNNNLGFFIRGIGNADSIIFTKDNTVGIYYDGVYSGRYTGMLSDLVDLERVEILRGPQGTLYGRNTTAGAVNFVTTKPTGELGLQQTVTVGNEELFRSITSVDLPDFSGFKARLGYVHSQKDGWVENSGPNKLPGGKYEDFYGEQNDGYRIDLRYDGIENLLVDYSYDSSDMKTTPAYFQYSGPTGIGASGPILASYTDRLKQTKNALSGGDYAFYLPKTKTDVTGQSLTISYDVNDKLTIKSITGYREFNDNLSQNFGNSFGDAGGFDVYVDSDYEQFTQELQFLGSAGSSTYVGGLYYLDEKSTAKETQYLNREAYDVGGVASIDLTTFTPCETGFFGSSFPACDTSIPFVTFLPFYLGEFTVKTEVESYAVYGQTTWTGLNDKLDLTVGARYTQDDRNAKRTNDGLPWNGNAPGDNDNDINQPDGTLVADYRWTDDISTYAKVSTAFRSGGSSPKAPDFTNTFDKETLLSYELGWKTQFMDNRIRLNGAVFYTRINDIILDQLPDPVNNPNVVEINNSGDADIYGLELDFLAAVTENLVVGVNYAYLDYDLKDADDTELVWAPENAYSIVADYNLPMADIGLFKIHFDYAWQDDQYSLANTNTPAGDVKVNDFGQLNARIALAEVQLAGGEWQFAVWSKNLTDEDDVNYQIGTTSTTYMQPRTYGMDVILRY